MKDLVSHKKPHITRHAQERAMQRANFSYEEAYSFLRHAWERGKRVPPYQAAKLHATYKSRARKHITYRLFENNLLLCRDQAIITMWKLSARETKKISEWLKKNGSR